MSKGCAKEEISEQFSEDGGLEGLLAILAVGMWCRLGRGGILFLEECTLLKSAACEAVPFHGFSQGHKDRLVACAAQIGDFP